MNWRRVLVDWPARLFAAWWTAYSVLLMVLIMVVVTLTVIALVLDGVFGIRWGW